MASKQTKTILRVTTFVLVVAFALSFGFAVGYNFHPYAKDFYTGGFRANFSFLPKLFGAYFQYQQREHKIADASEHESLLERVRTLHIGVYQPWPGYKIPVYDSLKALDLNTYVVEPNTPPETLVENYDVLIFPQGYYTLKDLTEGEGERLRIAVERGVDYIGICAGTYFAIDELEIAEVQHRHLSMVSILQVETVNNKFWDDWGGGKYQVHFAGGGYFPAESLGAFEPLVIMENLGVMAIKGTYHQGNVVLFTFHPEGGGLTQNNQSIYFNGLELGSGVLLLKVLANLAGNTP
jgi:hypothetical protein